MSKFKKRNRPSQEIPTSALPDIIFILLFFFIVTTKPRSATLKVDQKLARATELETLEDKHLVTYIHVGPPLDKNQYGSSERIQVNDQFIGVEDIPKFIAEEREKLKEKADQLVVVLKVDKDSKYGIVSDVKEQLREIDQQVINFNAAETKELD